MAETKAKGLADLARKYDDANDSLTGIVVESDFTPQSDNSYDLGSSSATFKDLYISGDIKGPATFNIDPSAHGDNTGTLVVKGNLQVDGTTTTINSTTVEVDDKLIFLGTGSVNAAAADGAGVEIDVGTNDPVVSNPSITYNATSDLWNFNKPISISGTQFINSSGVVLDSALDVGGSLSGSLSDVVVQYGVAYSGTPIQGSFFFDSLNQKLKVYTGSTFVDAVPAGTGSSGGTETDANTTFRKYVYTIASVTNAVTGADDNTNTLSYVTDGTENVEVFRNGIKMVQGDANADYAATTGTSVTFTYNLVVGDIVEVQVYELLTNDAYYVKSEVYTKAETNTQIASAFDGAVTINESGADADFRVEGSGQANALFVEGSSGNVGIGTDSPTAVSSTGTTLDVVGDSAGIVRVERTNSTNPSVGKFYAGNGAIEIGAESSSPLIFRTDNTERMRIDSNGHVLVAKVTENSPATVGHELRNSGSAWHTASNTFPLFLNRGGSDGEIVLIRKENSTVGSISVTSSGTTYNTTSDLRLKDNIQPISDGTEKLMAMNPVSHTWKADPKAPSVHGFIAQEMIDIIPEAVSGTPDGEEMMTMDYGRITPVLVAALQDAHKKIKELETRLNALQEK